MEQKIIGPIRLAADLPADFDPAKFCWVKYVWNGNLGESTEHYAETRGALRHFPGVLYRYDSGERRWNPFELKGAS